jgi:hypothetical protein
VWRTDRTIVIASASVTEIVVLLLGVRLANDFLNREFVDPITQLCNVLASDKTTRKRRSRNAYRWQLKQTAASRTNYSRACVALRLLALKVRWSLAILGVAFGVKPLGRCATEVR